MLITCVTPFRSTQSFLYRIPCGNVGNGAILSSYSNAVGDWFCPHSPAIGRPRRSWINRTGKTRCYSCTWIVLFYCARRPVPVVELAAWMGHLNAARMGNACLYHLCFLASWGRFNKLCHTYCVMFKKFVWQFLQELMIYLCVSWKELQLVVNDLKKLLLLRDLLRDTKI